MKYSENRFKFIYIFYELTTPERERLKAIVARICQRRLIIGN